MNVAVLIVLYALLAGATLRAIYLVMSFGSGGENSFDRPGVIIRNRWIPDVATILLFVAIFSVGYVGYQLYGWVGVGGTLAATALISCPLMGVLFRQRSSRASIYYSNPFFQLALLLPAFVVVSLFLSGYVR